jgi:hypothetical protein
MVVIQTMLAAFILGAVYVLQPWHGIVNSRTDIDLCWSCGQRGTHKLWCPNR